MGEEEAGPAAAGCISAANVVDTLLGIPCQDPEVGNNVAEIWSCPAVSMQLKGAGVNMPAAACMVVNKEHTGAPCPVRPSPGESDKREAIKEP